MSKKKKVIYVSLITMTLCVILVIADIMRGDQTFLVGNLISYVSLFVFVAVLLYFNVRKQNK
jgi:hypothetical protein